MPRKKVLFLCTGNTCRSQMAEAIVNARLGERWQAYSAGVQPAAAINPYTGKALAEIGIVHLGEPKHPDVFRDETFDLVVTLCDDAAENCPVWLGPGRKEHLGFPDPATSRGSEEQIMPIYRQVLKDIATKVPALLEREFNQAAS
ncbi:MAG: arsenate reductase ArsC [Anaerolineales bacterium]|nr:MAG: arsenate reductase ArsC [Anaerolineales bacterium]